MQHLKSTYVPLFLFTFVLLLLESLSYVCEHTHARVHTHTQEQEFTQQSHVIRITGQSVKQTCPWVQGVWVLRGQQLPGIIRDFF